MAVGPGAEVGEWNLLERSEQIHLVKCNYVKVFSAFLFVVGCVSFSKGLIKCFSFLWRDLSSFNEVSLL